MRLERKGVGAASRRNGMDLAQRYAKLPQRGVAER
jgi:hypothetical protein